MLHYIKFNHLPTSSSMYNTFFSHCRIELAENIPVDTTLLSLTCTDRDGTIPNNNISYHLMKDTFSNRTFSLTNGELKVSIIKSLSDYGPVINLR